MKKLLLISILTAMAFSHCFGQTTATDFTVNDCSGDSYSLFSKLDQGKIVLLAWVMPCSSCIVDPINAYAYTESFNDSHPNKIDFIIVDDYANTQCGSLVTWVEQYQMLNARTIVNSAVSMSDYGVDGMPKIVLLSGASHQVYFNENSSTEGFEAALDLALAENQTVVGVEEIKTESLSQLVSFPNPAANSLQVSYSLDLATEVRIDIMNAVGAEVLSSETTEKLGKGTHTKTMDLTDLNNGSYFLRITTNDSSEVLRFMVSK